MPRAILWIRQHQRGVLIVVAFLLVAAGLAAGLSIRKATPDIDVSGSSNPKAVHFLRRSLEVNPSTNITDRGRLAEMATLLELAVAEDPNYAAAHAELSRMHSQMYWHYLDHTEARAELAFASATEVLRLKPGYARGHLALAEYWFRCRRENAKAMDELALARQHTPRDPDIYNLIQLVAKRQGRWDQALAASRTLADMRPTNARDQNYLADTLQLMRRFPDALAAFDRAIYLEPEEREFVLNRAKLLYRWKGDLAPLERFVAALSPEQLASENEFYAVFLTTSLTRRYDDWFRIISARPDGFVFADKTVCWPKPMMLAFVQLARGDAAAARASLELARPILESRRAATPGEARVHASLGLLCALLGEHEQALREGERAAELMPVKFEPVFGTDIQQTLAQIHFHNGQPDKAVAILREVLSLPGDLTVHELKLDPAWDIARDTPQFRQLIETAK